MFGSSGTEGESIIRVSLSFCIHDTGERDPAWPGELERTRVQDAAPSSACLSVFWVDNVQEVRTGGREAAKETQTGSRDRGAGGG